MVSAHSVFDQAQAQAEQVEQRIERAIADHRARHGAPVEQLAFDLDVERVSPAEDGVAAGRASVSARRRSGQRGRGNGRGSCPSCGNGRGVLRGVRVPRRPRGEGRRGDGASVDHVVPLHAGGALIPQDTSGVRLVHTRCNTARGNRTRGRSPRPRAASRESEST